MDLSIRKQPQQPSPTPVSRPILNPAAPTTMLQGSAGGNSPLLPPPTTATVPTHNSIHHQQIKQQPHSYVPVPPVIQHQHQQRGMHPSKYAQLLNVIEEMGKDIKPTYAGNKNSAERLRRAIASARVLVRECQLECDRNSRP
ncbi:unnamed protein product [Rotaria socialis]|uniref:Cyclin-dependent kinase 2-associated protein n=1 Tax=Rotaria socialis TaxID=392032 RepID=A0A819UJT9_9BILA|nr:unnamed protein product [Rotaria socialis]CAF3325738.1 unnamed protein product [Rotaria socialis]CAF3336589.1 unnamed protein product [Rotaria socialis]CAF3423364.1 unnamed protein product [Rotaria socialis]CAF3668070.1 unnamed protein product [Rotaria socialis]